MLRLCAESGLPVVTRSGLDAPASTFCLQDDASQADSRTAAVAKAAQAKLLLQDRQLQAAQAELHSCQQQLAEACAEVSTAEAAAAAAEDSAAAARDELEACQASLRQQQVRQGVLCTSHCGLPDIHDVVGGQSIIH